MAQNKRKTGAAYEQAAGYYLEQQGYVILQYNYRCRVGEIDLIARDPAGVLCFVEVKTRSPRAIAPPREAVTAAKQRRLRDAASWYLAQTGWDGLCRFDVAEVWAREDGWHVKYIMSAFE